MEYVVLIIDIICAVIAGAITQSKGRSWWLGALLGFFLCGVGLIIVLFIPPTAEARISSAADLAVPAGAGTLSPGWYTDPHDSTQLRYWDGAWTQQRKPRDLEVAPPSKTPAPALPVAALDVPHSDPVEAGWHEDPLSSSRLRYHDGTTWTDRTAEKGIAPPPATLPPPRSSFAALPAESHGHSESSARLASEMTPARVDDAGGIRQPGSRDVGRGADQPAALTPGPPAGWFADPESPAQIRYWDGTRWTDAVAPRP